MTFSLFEIKLQKLKNNSKSAVFTKVQLPENDFSDKFVMKTTFLINFEEMLKSWALTRRIAPRTGRGSPVTPGACCSLQTQRCACALLEGKGVPYIVKRAPIECVWLDLIGRELYSAYQNIHLRVKKDSFHCQIDVFPAKRSSKSLKTTCFHKSIALWKRLFGFFDTICLNSKCSIFSKCL